MPVEKVGIKDTEKESEGISGWGQNLKIFPPEWKEWIIHLAIS